MMFRRMICAMILIMMTVFAAAAEGNRVECFYTKRMLPELSNTLQATDDQPDTDCAFPESVSAAAGQEGTAVHSAEDSTTENGNTEDTASYVTNSASDKCTEVITDADASEVIHAEDGPETAATGSIDHVEAVEEQVSADEAKAVKEKISAQEAEEQPQYANSTKEKEHEHVWKTETVFHEAVTHTVHHEEITEQRWVSVPVTVTTYVCDVCGKVSDSQNEAYAHEDATYQKAMETGDFSSVHTGHTIVTGTIDNGYYETVMVAEAWDETVTESPSWEEKHTYCGVCGAEG